MKAMPQCPALYLAAVFKGDRPRRVRTTAIHTGPMYRSRRPTTPLSPITTCTTPTTVRAPWICPYDMTKLASFNFHFLYSPFSSTLSISKREFSVVNRKSPAEPVWLSWWRVGRVEYHTNGTFRLSPQKRGNAWYQRLWYVQS